MLNSLLSSLFSCSHVRTQVNEGKCYCPDCGSGLIYRWVVLRCSECQTRRESRYQLRRVIPSQRCCPFCGAHAVFREYLDNPGYFQLHQARLMVFFEESSSLSLMGCLSYLLGEALSLYIADSIRTTYSWFEVNIGKPPPTQPVLAFLPLYSQNNAI